MNGFSFVTVLVTFLGFWYLLKVSFPTDVSKSGQNHHLKVFTHLALYIIDLQVCDDLIIHSGPVSGAYIGFH